MLLFQFTPSQIDILSALLPCNLNDGGPSVDDDGTGSNIDDATSDVEHVISDVPGVSPGVAGDLRATDALGDNDDDEDARDSIVREMFFCDVFHPESSCVPMTHNKTAFSCSNLIAPTPSRS